MVYSDCTNLLQLHRLSRSLQCGVIVLTTFEVQTGFLGGLWWATGVEVELSLPVPPGQVALSESAPPPGVCALTRPSADYQLNPATMSSNKTFRVKRILAKAQVQNRPIPQWCRLKTDAKITYNAKRRHWRRTKLNL
ncbi:hypothetical protein PSTG_10822 [Puccinia striiformis f. sp. tritici PST-78]|uniref:Large ribosomal subunit protein eL39 n=1 Tax=Puccinia striiformis f. sp. tritici PST-78 TaxID=1165861 RepID=A0A0L0V9D7_9BASI|nr:hypothetical protein PSTG_10822 [Puccinia striiformis f. sp. tritici PST-78]